MKHFLTDVRRRILKRAARALLYVVAGSIPAAVYSDEYREFVGDGAAAPIILAISVALAGAIDKAVRERKAAKR